MGVVQALHFMSEIRHRSYDHLEPVYSGRFYGPNSVSTPLKYMGVGTPCLRVFSATDLRVGRADPPNFSRRRNKMQNMRQTFHIEIKCTRHMKIV